MTADGGPAVGPIPRPTPGPIRFDRFVDSALYDPGHGFFATGGGAGGRGGDFITSAEVGPTFGAIVANWLDEAWEQLGRPSPFRVVEAGAGRGALAIAVRAASPACLGEVDYVLVERSAALRARQGEHLPIDEGGGGDHRGPRFHGREDLPGPVAGAGVVIANELLDNIASRLCERTEGGWSEVWVRPAPVTPTASGAHLEELRPVDEAVARELDLLAPGAARGARVPWAEGAARWCSTALGLHGHGRVLVFDYGDTTATLATRPQHEWLRTYRGHARGSAPTDAPGTQDITFEVPFDQLPAGPQGPAVVSLQSEWLGRHGLAALVESARATWEARAATGDLAALRARSVGVEAAALTDPAGLGSFRVIEWRI